MFLKRQLMNLTGKVFSRLTVIKRIEKHRYTCKCSCGNLTNTTHSDLVTGNTKSCGCLQKERTSQARLIDLTNKRFGRLKVLYREGIRNGYASWKCLCDCGNTKIIVGGSLRNGGTTSCGCYQKEITGKKNTKNLIGKKFGKLIVISRKGIYNKTGQIIWECKCKCGRMSFPLGTNLLLGSTTSCGYCNGSVSKSGTLFLDYLEEIFGIKIRREYKIKRFRFDGKIKNILIEVDGSYWHQNMEERENRKDKLAKEKGFKVVRCNVDDMRKSKEKAFYYKNKFVKIFKENYIGTRL